MRRLEHSGLGIELMSYESRGQFIPDVTSYLGHCCSHSISCVHYSL
jgi:hypothetical protein